MENKPETEVERDDEGNEVNTNDLNELWQSDPKCIHHIICAAGGGIKCTKCGGWYCY